MMENSAITYYATSLEHILAELEQIDLLIWLQVWKARQLQSADHPFQGLYLSEQEVDTLLSKPTGMPSWANSPTSGNAPETQHALAQLSRHIGECKSESARQGIPLRLVHLADCFGLSALEVNILLVCLAPELDLRYEKLFAYLQDDLTKKRPSVDLVLNLLCPSFDQKIAARSHLAPDAPLFKYHLLSLFEDTTYQHSPLLSKYLNVDEPVVNYLLGIDLPDARFISYVKRIILPEDAGDDTVPDSLKQWLILWTSQPTKDQDYPLLYFQGSNGIGKQRSAAAICQELKLTLQVVDAAQLLKVQDVTFETAVRLLLRDALFKEAALYWHNFDLLLQEDNQPGYQALFSELETYRGLVFLAGERVWEPADGVYERPFLRIEFLHPTYNERQRWWHTLLDEVVHPDDRPTLDEVADKFIFTISQIQDAALTARNLTLRRIPTGGLVTPADFYSACRLHSNQRLTTLAQKLVPRNRWTDIVLPADQLQQLRELCAGVKHRSLVLNQWGFDRKLSLGKGFTALFAGPSGTGKTMAAEIIANELGLDLYKIDLSTIISKYIGETEKNLSRIFAEATTSNAILFFDEADALFGKRSEVKDSHDRYANIETSYLLQKMDEYEGVTLLATNLRKNMDAAFIRRMAFTVYFPLPNETDRLHIWKGIWPSELPRSSDLDLPFMARQFKLTGGNIKNIALAGAFLAADNGQEVGMNHLILATKREFQKSGKVCVKSEFGLYYPLIEDRP